MKNFKSLLCNPTFYLLLITTITLPAMSNAESYYFKVTFADVPGFEEIHTGNYAAAIDILEKRADDANNQYVHDELATLCALYVMKGKLVAARRTCQDAVETDQSDASYNNRGVFRAHVGDAAGAALDFERARVLPDDQQRYIEEVMKRDARMIASGNYAEVLRLAARRVQPESLQALASSVRGASVEDLGN
jgi:hypothetical protein